MEIYKKEDFAKVRYNVYDLPDGTPVTFDDLGSYPIFNQKIGVSCPTEYVEIRPMLLFRWIVYMYDINSPLVNILDIRKRAVIAAMEAGFKKTTKSKKFNFPYDEVVNFSGTSRVEVFKRIVQYCRIQRDYDYTQMVVYELLRMNNNNKLIDATDITEISNLIKVQTTLDENLTKLRTRFLNGDDSVRSYNDLMDTIETENLEFSPEQIVLNDSVRARVDSFNVYGAGFSLVKFNKGDLDEKEKIALNNELRNNTNEARSHFTALGLDINELE